MVTVRYRILLLEFGFGAEFSTSQLLRGAFSKKPVAHGENPVETH